MAKQPRNVWEELTQITDEFRIMHARVNGETHAQAARTEVPHYSHKLQRQALERWNCKNLHDYKKMHASALRAIMYQIREHATQTDPKSHWFEQLIISHEMFRLMHEQTPGAPPLAEPMRDATTRAIPERQQP